MAAVKEAYGLPQMNAHGLTNAKVRLLLLPKSSLLERKKTACVKGSLNPVWNEEFEYKYSALQELKMSRVLELTVWNYDRRGCNDFIGCVRLGPSPDGEDIGSKDWMTSNDKEVEHWTKMLSHPGEWVEAWHDLQPSIGKRSASLAKDLQRLNNSSPLNSIAKVEDIQSSMKSHPLTVANKTSFQMAEDSHSLVGAIKNGRFEKSEDSHPLVSVDTFGDLQKSECSHRFFDHIEVGDFKKPEKSNSIIAVTKKGTFDKSEYCHPFIEDSHRSVTFEKSLELQMSEDSQTPVFQEDDEVCGNGVFMVCCQLIITIVLVCSLRHHY